MSNSKEEPVDELARRARLGDEAAVDELIRRARHGDKAALGGLLEWILHRFGGLAKRFFDNWFDAEDILQEAVMELIRRPEILTRPEFELRKWFATVLRSKAANIARREKRRPTGPLFANDQEVGDSNHPTSTEDPSDSVVRSERARALKGCMDRLSEILREVVMLRYFEGKELVIIALELEENYNTIKARQRQALIRLRRCLGPNRKVL